MHCPGDLRSGRPSRRVMTLFFGIRHNLPLPPPLGHPPVCDNTVFPVRNRGEISRLGDPRASQSAIEPPMGGRVGERGDHHLKRGFPLKIENTINHFTVFSHSLSSRTMNSTAPEGTPPRRINYLQKRQSAPPCPGGALRRGALAHQRFSCFGCELPFMYVSIEQDILIPLNPFIKER